MKTILSQIQYFDSSHLSLSEIFDGEKEISHEIYARTAFNDVSLADSQILTNMLQGITQNKLKSFENALEEYKKLGAELVDVDLSVLKYSIAVYYILATAEASTNLARFDGIRYGLRSARAKTLDEVYDFSKEDGFGKEVKRSHL